MFVIYAHCASGVTEVWAATRTLASARKQAQKALDENPVGDGGGVVWCEIFGPGIEESEGVERPPDPDAFKVGDEAWTPDGHNVRILRFWEEEGVQFAVIRYLDGFVPYPVGGRAGGSEDDPIWEHRVKDGKVVRAGGDYYNPADWYVEKGLSREEPTIDRDEHAEEVARREREGREGGWL